MLCVSLPHSVSASVARAGCQQCLSVWARSCEPKDGLILTLWAPPPTAPASDHTGALGGELPGPRVTTNAGPNRRLEPRPGVLAQVAPTRARPGGCPHSPSPFVAHGPWWRPQGGPRRQRLVWKIPGRQEERGPARSRVPRSASSALPAAAPAPGPARRLQPACQPRRTAPGRGQGRGALRAERACA